MLGSDPIPEAGGGQTPSGLGTITIQVLLFAQLKDRLGQPEISASLPLKATGRDLIRALSQRDPAIAPLVAVSRLAVGQEYVSWSHPLKEGDEVAVIPPVSGG